MECKYCHHELKVERINGVGTDYWIVTTCPVHGTLQERGK